MKRNFDPLYTIFEHHLYTALVEEETSDEFIVRVVNDYLEDLSASGTVIPHPHRTTVESDLKEEVLEMLRKKTYGHYNLAEFRKAKAAEISAAPRPAVQRQRRAN